MSKDVTVRLRVTQDEAVGWKMRARSLGLSLSDLIRQAMKGGGSHAGVSENRSARDVLPGAAHPVKTREAMKVEKPKGHDTKSCRLYGCLQCKALGVEDKRRGL